MIAIDSSALIDLAKDNGDIKKLLSGIDEKIVSTLVNYFEIIIGIDITNPYHDEQREFFWDLFNNIELLHLDKKSSELSSKIFWQKRKSKKEIDKSDCMIAGILLSNGVDRIITRNVRHFENIPGLKVISY